MFNEDTWQFILKHAQEDTKKLALKRNDNGLIDMKQALTQIEGYQTAVKKLPLWASNRRLVYPPRISMEQCSSETTAQYKQLLAKRLLGAQNRPLRMADMTGGFGIDFSYLAPLFESAIYMEQQEVLCQIARYNFPILGLSQAQVVQGDGVSLMSEHAPYDLIFIDPARRDEMGKKTVALRECTPDLGLIQDEIMSCSPCCIAKLSPMLDIQQALQVLKHAAEVHLVSVDNECKELLVVLKRDFCGAVRFCCVNILKKETQTYQYDEPEETEAIADYTDLPEKFLYEPNTSVLKAGAFKGLCQRFGVKKLHPNSHLYTSERLVRDFPGRRFRITGKYGFSKQELKELTRDISQANITIRNFPTTVAELRKKLKIKEGGNTYLFATTLKNGQHVLITGVRTEEFPD